MAMKKLMRRFRARAVAGLLGLGAPSAALAQAPAHLPDPIAPAMPAPLLPPPTVTVLPGALPAPVSVSTPLVPVQTPASVPIPPVPAQAAPAAATPPAPVPAPPSASITPAPVQAPAPPNLADALPSALPSLTSPGGTSSPLPGSNTTQPSGSNSNLGNLPSGAPTTLPTVPTVAPTQMPAGTTSRLPGALRGRAPVRTQPAPLLSSQPPPFQITPDTPAATQDPNFFEGFRSVQDLTDILPGRFRETRYKWYGFIRLDGIYDFRPMASTDSFVTSAIPIPQGRGQNTVLTPRYTRLGFDTETPIKSMDWTLKTRIEMDFFNGNTSGLFGSFPIRLRFAWADFGPFLIGQAASLFMDYDVFPNVLDYQGPGGMILMRQPLFAVRAKLGERTTAMVGVEQPYSDIQWFENGAWIVNPGSGIITTPGVGRNVQDLPDFTANVRRVGDYGHVQLAGILRKLTFQPGVGDSALDELGYGVNLTGTFHPWAALTNTPRDGDCATVWAKSRFLGQFAAGRGIARYLQDENGLGLDATFDPVNGFRTIPAYGWFAAYEQWWAKRLASVFTYGQDALELTDTLPGSTYLRANYVSANLIWLPVDRMGVGVEYLYGFRKNKDGGRGENSRIQMAFQYRF
jgi:hypothetical protein